MRISDWSSDVCSSDLKAKAHTRRRTIDDTEQRLVHTRQPRHRHMQCACKLAYGCSAIVAGSLHHANVSAHAEQSSRAGDRKSVVKGKSVSVRVDLGGPRIIKNKKNKKYRQSERTRHTNN